MAARASSHEAIELRQKGGINADRWQEIEPRYWLGGWTVDRLTNLR
jgi:hypothetical protein